MTKVRLTCKDRGKKTFWLKYQCHRGKYELLEDGGLIFTTIDGTLFGNLIGDKISEMP